MKTKYTTEELQEFKDNINRKIKIAQDELDFLLKSIKNPNENGTHDTYSQNKQFEDVAITKEREQMNRLAERQKMFIDKLQHALLRIQNGTYGICRETGKLISKERLKAVPHATLCIGAKQKQKREARGGRL